MNFFSGLVNDVIRVVIQVGFCELKRVLVVFWGVEKFFGLGVMTPEPRRAKNYVDSTATNAQKTRRAKV